MLAARHDDNDDDDMSRKEKEEDSSALRIVWMQQFNDSKNIQKKNEERLITEAKNSNIDKQENYNKRHPGNKNEKKNNYQIASNDKLRKVHPRWAGYG